MSRKTCSIVSYDGAVFGGRVRGKGVPRLQGSGNYIVANTPSLGLSSLMTDCSSGGHYLSLLLGSFCATSPFYTDYKTCLTWSRKRLAAVTWANPLNPASLHFTRKYFVDMCHGDELVNVSFFLPWSGSDKRS
eukprot:962096-Amphidinium_carterae.1